MSQHASHSHELEDDGQQWFDYIKHKKRVGELMEKTAETLDKRSEHFTTSNTGNGTGSRKDAPVQNIFRDMHHNLTFLLNADFPSLKNHLPSEEENEHVYKLIKKVQSRLHDMDSDFHRIRMKMGMFFDSEEKMKYFKDNPEKEQYLKAKEEHSEPEQDNLDDLTQNLVSENHHLKKQLRVASQKDFESQSRIEALLLEIKQMNMRPANDSTPSEEMTNIGIPKLSALKHSEIVDPENISNQSIEDASQIKKTVLPNFQDVEMVEGISSDSLMQIESQSHRQDLQRYHSELDRLQAVSKIDIYEKSRIIGRRLNYFQKHRAKLPKKREKGPRSSQLFFVLFNIYGSNVLWQEKPSSMQMTMDEFLPVFRKKLSKYSGYENYGECEHWVCIFSDPCKALQFMRDMQLSVLNLEYPGAMLSHEICKEVSANDPITTEKTVVYRGLRIPMFLHTSKNVNIRKNFNTNRDEYFAEEMGFASRVLQLLEPGHVVMSQQARASLNDETATQKHQNIQFRQYGKKLAFIEPCEIIINKLRARTEVNQRGLRDIVLSRQYYHSVRDALYDTKREVNFLKKEMENAQYRMNIELELNELNVKKKERSASQEAFQRKLKQLNRQRLLTDNFLSRMIQKCEAVEYFVHQSEDMYKNHETFHVMDSMHHHQSLSLEIILLQMERFRSERRRRHRSSSTAASPHNPNKNVNLPVPSPSKKPQALLPKTTSYDKRLLSMEKDAEVPVSLSPVHTSDHSNKKRLTPLGDNRRHRGSKSPRSRSKQIKKG